MTRTHPLDSFDALQPYLPRLGALGYRTLEQLTGAARVAGPALSSYLGAPIARVLARVPMAAAALAASSAPPVFALGVNLDAIKPRRRAFVARPLGLAPLPKRVNIVDRMRAVRDQGHRPTCVAHAATAALEARLSVGHTRVDLSRQFLYWDCKRVDDDPDGGTLLEIGFLRLKEDACCLEATWPYDPDPIPDNEGQGPPPAGATQEARAHRLRDFVELAPNAVEDIKAQLAGDRAVACSFPVFPSWHGNQEVARTGEITMPIPGEVRVGGHAVCFAGYQDERGAPGGGRFIVRNSWGATRWGVTCRFGAGYGTLPYAYVERYGAEAFAPA